MLWAKSAALITSYHTRGFVEEEKNRCPIGQPFIYKSTLCGVGSQITTPIIPPDNILFILQAQPVTAFLQVPAAIVPISRCLRVRCLKRPT